MKTETSINQRKRVPRTTTISKNPTPIHRWDLPGLPNATELWIKVSHIFSSDFAAYCFNNFTGMELSGNKVRKLEFLLAEAVDQQADTVITISGAITAVPQPSQLTISISILISFFAPPSFLPRKILGWLGIYWLSVSLELMFISSLRKSVSPLGVRNWSRKEESLMFILVGGSNSLGTCGGTIAGISLGSWLGALKAKVHAFSVCDDPDYFYYFVQGLLYGLQAGVNSRNNVNIHNAPTAISHGPNTPSRPMDPHVLPQMKNPTSMPVYWIINQISKWIMIRVMKDIQSSMTKEPAVKLVAGWRKTQSAQKFLY
ncbi:unnamed protein product [Arabis nemorensis]|uniref:Uncharacterized protein n=1 Tax=Arabis nemorensis TaxID=586526 RepID=A0A565BJ84_9BRAS|nr:unnamed protein product [Arabis nemorensis]